MANTKKSIAVLIIEGDSNDMIIVRKMLEEGHEWPFVVDVEANLESGLEKLSRGKPDILLLSLNLPDSQGPDALTRVRTLSSTVPVIVLTGQDDETFALEMLRLGAQDYLVKGFMEPRALSRAIHSAIERYRTDIEMRNLLLVHELTGLYNRQGFVMFADRYLKLAQRSHEGLILLFVEIENFKRIKEIFGQHECDLATLRTAKTLRDTFRASDIIGQLGHDYFSVLAPEVQGDKYEATCKRLQEKLLKTNEEMTAPYRIALSLGFVFCDPVEKSATIEELMTRANHALLAAKKH